jgi:hypothetical protein
MKVFRTYDDTTKCLLQPACFDYALPAITFLCNQHPEGVFITEAITIASTRNRLIVHATKLPCCTLTTSPALTRNSRPRVKPHSDDKVDNE